jgi:hypothetical protein
MDTTEPSDIEKELSVFSADFVLDPPIPIPPALKKPLEQGWVRETRERTKNRGGQIHRDVYYHPLPPLPKRTLRSKTEVQKYLDRFGSRGLDSSNFDFSGKMLSPYSEIRGEIFVYGKGKRVDAFTGAALKGKQLLVYSVCYGQ